MSVYIKGMEMPKHGSYLLTVRYDADGNLCVYPLIYMTGYDDRDLKPETPLFPIIPVPDHGGLIDLKAPFEAQYYDDMTEEWMEKSVTVEDVLYGCMVCDMPPVIIPGDKEEEK